MTTNSKILVPVDFSEHATNAIEYACLLCEKKHISIDFIHILTNRRNIYHNIQQQDSADPVAEEVRSKMNDLRVQYQTQYPSIKFSTLLREGNLFEQLRKVVSEDSYEAIIMGTKGSSGLDALLIGSNMFEVFQNSRIPVLAVPQSKVPHKTDKIGLLCNFKDGEIDVLQQAIKLYGNNFQLLLIHINTTNSSILEIDKKFKHFISKVIKETKIEDISYVVKAQNFLIQNKEDISAAINSVISDELIDALLITKSKKGFLRKIIEENVVKRMAYEIQIPKFFGKS